MKTILVPTDFSKTADNALKYAIELARATNSSIIVLYIHYQPFPNNDFNFPTESELEELNNEAIESLQKKIKTNELGIKIEIDAQFGLAADVIPEVVEEKNIDLIIIGLPETGIFEETILGNNAMETIRNSTSPVLILPSKAEFNNPNVIVFATDYLELKNDQVIVALSNFALLFNAKLHIINIMKEDEKTSSKKVAAILNVKKLLKGIDYSIHFPVDENVISGIKEFVLKTEAKMIAMIPHKHTIFYRWFNLSNTKKMVFHSNIPILALPENIPKQERQGAQKNQKEIVYSKIDLQYLEY